MLHQAFFDVKSGLLPFSVAAKTVGKFPQTGHSPRNGANQAANDWVADQAAFRGKVAMAEAQAFVAGL